MFLLLDQGGISDKEKRILLATKHFHIFRPASTKLGTNMSPLLMLLKVVHGPKLDSVHSLSGRYQQVTNLLSLFLEVSFRGMQIQKCIPEVLPFLQA